MLVSLAKALKLKNRQAAKVAELQRKIASSNSYLEGSTPDFDALAMYDQLKRQIDTLIDLKAGINTANAPIQPVIYRLAELKGQVTFLRSLNTQRGKVLAGYMVEMPQEYVAQIDAQAADAEISRIEAEIDDLQDQLDAHNAGVKIEVEIAP